jgi:proteasome lid subunit RPN8/RPN11
MKLKPKSVSAQPSVIVDSEVVRRIRQHARSSSKTEICGVLIGQDRDLRVEVTASIEGENADQAGAHVTFTQDTWEHIYAVKDKKFPNERIVGWYHSHPGFGIFLSEHDTFIHKNFFSSPGQLAWVFDPHSDEEGCFGWVDGRIERLTRISVFDRRGGELATESTRGEARSSPEDDDVPPVQTPARTGKPSPVIRFELKSDSDESSISLEQLVAKVFFSLALLALGGALSWYFFPHVAVVPVLVDPMTGNLVDPQTGQVVGQLQPDKASPQQATPAQVAPAPADSGGKKGDNANPK